MPCRHHKIDAKLSNLLQFLEIKILIIVIKNTFLVQNAKEIIGNNSGLSRVTYKFDPDLERQFNGDFDSMSVLNGD